MNKLLYRVLGNRNGDNVIGAYRESLKHLDTGSTIEEVNEAMSATILKLFSPEVSCYCDRKYEINEWVVGEIVDDLQTYHYL